MEKYLGKKYKLKSSDNFDEYLKFIEVGLLSRKLVTSLSPVCVLSKNEDGTYCLTMITVIRKVVIPFRLNEEFIEERPDGVKVKSIVRVEGNDLIQVQIEDNGRKSLHVREFTDKTLTVAKKTRALAAAGRAVYQSVRDYDGCNFVETSGNKKTTTAEGWNGKCVRVYEFVE